MPTMWRTLEATNHSALERIEAARANARATAWRPGYPGFYVIDIDATLVNAHSEKRARRPTTSTGSVSRPWSPSSTPRARPWPPSCARATPRPDRPKITWALLDAALAQLPVDPLASEVIARTDSAGASHGFVDAAGARVRFVVGHRLSAEPARLVVDLPQKRWMSTISADGTQERDAGVVAEITDLVDLGLWPQGTRMVVRREEPHPGAQLTFSDVDGHRYQLLITDHPQDDVAFLEALYRGRGRCERRICDAKDTGLENLLRPASPSTRPGCLGAHRKRPACLDARPCLEGALQKAEPKRLRYTLLHSAGILVRSARRTTLRIAAGWPWADDLVTAFARLPGWMPATT